MARRRATPVEIVDPGLDMSSLIDVSFLLLIYFISTSTLQPKESDLGMVLPTSDSPSSQVQIDQMSIQLNGQGMVVVNDDVLDTDINSRSLPLLKDRLKDYKAAADLSDTNPVVILSADDSAKGQRFVDVLNTIAEVGIKSVTLAGFQSAGSG